MGDAPLLKDTATPPQPPTNDAPSFRPPAQDHAPSDLPDDRHGFTLRFEFQPPNTPTRHNAPTRPDTFNAAEALRGLADGLFTSAGGVQIHDTYDGDRIISLQEWPKTDIKFQSFFEVFTPTTGRLGVFVI
ncbi:hypothetical protein ACA910_019999 [Epithemia clementina (nom. ined.)]